MDQELQNAFEDLLTAVSKMHYLSHLTRPSVTGVTPVEMRVLADVFFSTQREEEVRPGLLASRLGSTKSALSQVLRSLEDKGLITRSRSEKDSRAVVVKLTKEGSASLEAIHSDVAREMSELVSCIGIDDLRFLKETVDRIADFYQKRASEQGKLPDEIPAEPPLSVRGFGLCGRGDATVVTGGDESPCA